MKKMIFLVCLTLFLVPMVWAQEKTEAPVWNVGDKWTYKSHTVREGKWTNKVVDVKEDLYIVEISGVRDLTGYDKTTMNVKYLIEPSGRRLKSTSVSRKLFDCSNICWQEVDRYDHFCSNRWHSRS